MCPENPPPVLLRVHDPDADEARIEDLTAALRRELSELDLPAVTRVPAGSAPPGTRGGEMVELGALMVSAVTTPALLGAIVATVRAWLGYQGRREVEIAVGGKSVRITGRPTEAQQRLIEELMRPEQAQPP
jgi:hypothetical protein